MGLGFLVALLALLALFLVIGAVLGWAGFFRAARLQQAVTRLERELARPERPSNRGDSRDRPQAPIRAEEPPARQAAEPPPSTPPTTQPPAPEPSFASAEERPVAPGAIERFIENVTRHWMIWLGGVSVALAGIFLVGYGIEIGLLGPRGRIAAAVLAGLVLHGAAEWLRRRTGSAHPAFAALAGGASITLYAAVYAALELYSLLSPGLAFTLLAVVSVVTMALALVHGPMLAMIGILGAYVVPLLVQTDTGNMIVAMIYSLIVTAAALLLIRYVYRPWLWYGMLTGAFFWWLLSLTSMDADGFRGLYIAALAYLTLAVPVLDWTLGREPMAGDPGTERIARVAGREIDVLQLTMLAITLAQAVSIAHLGFTGVAAALLAWSPLIVIVIATSRARASIAFAPWGLMIAQWFAWLYSAIDLTGGGWRLAGLETAAQGQFLSFAFAMSMLFSVGIWLVSRGRPFSHLRASQIWLSPVLWLALAYLLVTDLSTAWEWSLASLGLGLTYVYLSGRRLRSESSDAAAVWLLLGGHLAYSIAAAMFFREATLTLALAAQLISLAWLNRRFAVPALQWIVKAVLALVVIRLTLNPWLLTYPVDTHWSLWTYGGSALCCWIGALGTDKDTGLGKWLEAASLHLLVLFLGAETRYQLYDGMIFADDFTLTEAAVYTSLWGGLGLSYFYRSRAAERLAAFYAACARVLMVLALASYALSLTVLNPLWSDDVVASTPIWNILLLAYGAPILIAVATCFYYEPRFKRVAALVACGATFVFVSLEIRHLWNGALDLDLPTKNGELYTYSAVWTIMAALAILGSTALGSRDGYRVGMGLLFVVIAKIFLIDMADLEGLLRVSSFMGLGLALLALAYLHQRMSKRAARSAVDYPK